MKTPTSVRSNKSLVTQSCVTWIARIGFLSLFGMLGCGNNPKPEVANDEAKLRALAESKNVQQAAKEWFYPTKVENYFDGMDTISVSPNGPPDQLIDVTRKSHPDQDAKSFTRSWYSTEKPTLKTNETLGRNTWMIWCAGNEGFWDWLATDNLGFIDLLKLVDSRKRNTRFQDVGLINEPQMVEASAPSPGEFGLWIDAPQDARIREWREHYVEQTFTKISKGTHKTQRGLFKKNVNNKTDLYRGGLTAQDLRYDYGYDLPSKYFGENSSYGGGYTSGSYPTGSYAVNGNVPEPGYGTKNYYDERLPPPDIYGLSSGVVGLRLFPNPYFDEDAQKRWSAERYYTDRDYYTDPSLVRPYRVGMSCAFCHASFHPLNPPNDVTSPEWANISGNIGAQYLSMRASVGSLLTPDSFAYHLLESQPRGTIDTSLIASDNINNPNTMNAVFNLPQRSLLAFRNPPEQLSQASAELPSLWRYPDADPAVKHPDGLSATPTKDPQYDSSLETFKEWGHVFQNQDLLSKLKNSNQSLRPTTRVLLDGSDSIGPYGALARVYLNIGSYYERWNQLHQPVIGLTPQSPFSILDCETNSVYWNATRLRVGAMRDYFLKVTPPMPLLSTPGGEERIQAILPTTIAEKVGDDKSRMKDVIENERALHVDLSKLSKGREVFAKNCIICHSSIQPESSAVTFFPGPVDGQVDEETKTNRQNYEKQFENLIKKRIESRERWAHNGEHWEHDPGQWLRNETYNKWALDAVEKKEFWKWNYLSTDYRIPINVVKTNAGRAMGTNAMAGHVWDDFASDSYQDLPSPGAIEYFNPYAGKDGTTELFTPRHKTPPGAPEGGGGPGYYRVPSLVSIWATAPFLHNNSLGLFNNDPSVNGRLKAFDDAIHKLLYPDRRLQSSSYNDATPERLAKDHGLIWRTSQDSDLVLEARRVPFFAKRFWIFSALNRYFPWLEKVYPLWLPSLIILLAAVLVLSLSQFKWRRGFAYATWIGALLLAVVLWGANYFSGVVWLDPLRLIKPMWFPVVVSMVVGLVFWLPLSKRKTRYAGYALVAAGLFFGFFINFNAGKLGDVRIGPIPKGTPVNLLANLNSEADPAKLARAFSTTLAGLADIQSRHLSEAESKKIMHDKIAPALMEVNKCPDFVMDHGHYFEWFKSMTDEDKEALIELLKTF